MRDCGLVLLDGFFRARVALPQKQPTVERSLHRWSLTESLNLMKALATVLHVLINYFPQV